MTVFPLLKGNIFHNDLFCNSDNKDEKTPEQSVWRAVITQALMDAASNSSTSAARRNKMDALKWLQDVNQDFEMVCALAGMDVDYVKVRIDKALQRGCKWRNDKRPEMAISMDLRHKKVPRNPRNTPMLMRPPIISSLMRSTQRSLC